MPESAHAFFVALSYIPYTFIVYAFLLYAPAIAVFPRLTEKPVYFIGVPIISLLINAFIAAVLFKLQWYSHAVVLPIALLFMAVALIRRPSCRQWQKNDFYLMFINFMTLVPLLVLCGLTAFMDDDALASWNSWAEYYYYANTHAAVFFSASGYPPFFPLLISYIYQFLGTAAYQGVAKTVLVIFPFTAMNCIAFAGKVSQRLFLIFVTYLIIAAVSIFVERGYLFYGTGYADPLLVACLTLAIFWTILYWEEPNEHNDFVLVLAVLATIAASLSKQPGFLWALFGFPLIFIIKIIQAKRFKWVEVFAMIAVCIPVLLWILGPGSGFAQNAGVIGTSTGSNTLHMGPLFSALGDSLIKYWVESPLIFLLYLWAWISVRKNLTLSLIFFAFILPSTILWFMLGSYDVRLGLQLLSACALLISYKGFYPLNHIAPNIPFNFKKIAQIFGVLGIACFIFFTINENHIKHGFVRGHLYPLNGPKTLIDHYYNQDGKMVYTQIYLHPEKKLWIASWFIAALFAHNNAIITPPITNNIPQIYDNIISTKPDYLFTCDYPPQFPAEDAFKKIAQQCPFLFKEIPLHKQKSKLNYRIFKFEGSAKARLHCQKELHNYVSGH